jgi:hypothetical protein
MLREQWLLELIEKLRPVFEDKGVTLPAKIRASCSFPSKMALSNKNRRIGEAWSDKNSDDQTFEIFISPLLKDPIEVAGVVVHECIHVAVGIEAGHRGPFKTLATSIGLEGKMTSTTVGESLKSLLQTLTNEIGNYPHAKLVVSNKPKTQSTRQLKVVCKDCGCICRMTRKWMEEVGCPFCACGGVMLHEENDGD